MRKKIINILIIVMLIFNTSVKNVYAFAFAPPIVAYAFEEIIVGVASLIGVGLATEYVAEHSDEMKEDFANYLKELGYKQQQILEIQKNVCIGIIDTTADYYKALINTVKNWSKKALSTIVSNDTVISVNDYWQTSSTFKAIVSSIVAEEKVYFYCVKNEKETKIFILSVAPFRIVTDNYNLQKESVVGHTTYSSSTKTIYETSSGQKYDIYNTSIVGSSAMLSYYNDSLVNTFSTIQDLRDYLYKLLAGEIESSGAVALYPNAEKNLDDTKIVAPAGVMNINKIYDNVKPDELVGSIQSGALTLENIRDIAGVQTVVGENVIAGDGTITDEIAIENGALTDEDANNLKPYQTLGLSKIFPFCIPFDLYECFKLFQAEPVAPHFDWEFRVGNHKEKLHIDLKKFDSVAEICRTLFLIIFIIGLLIKTRDMIRG